MKLGMTHLIIDHDSKYVAGFDAVLEADGVKVKRVGPRAPNMNAFAERFVQTLRYELLDYFIIMGEKHLTYLLSEYLSHNHGERPHQGIGNILIERGTDPPATLPFSGTVECRERLGGLLKSYARAA